MNQAFDVHGQTSRQRAGDDEVHRADRLGAIDRSGGNLDMAPPAAAGEMLLAQMTCMAQLAHRVGVEQPAIGQRLTW